MDHSEFVEIHKLCLYYAKLKKQKSDIENDIKKVESEIIKEMDNILIDTFEIEDGKISKTTRTSVTYDSEVKNEIAQIKKQAETDGKCSVKFLTFLRFYKSKGVSNE